MSDERDWTRIDRYLAGECSPAEAAETERWIESEPGLRELVEGMRHTGRAGEWHPDAAAAWARMSGAVSRAETPVISIARSRRAGAVPVWAWRAAAAVALVAGGLGVWTLLQRTSGPGESVAMTEAVTLRAQRTTISLPDGTTVLLAPESRLRYAVGLRGRTRDVVLEGEGFFMVAHDPSRPFRVHAGSAVARALGTRFAVRARTDEGPVGVVVSEGRVQLRPAAAGDSGAVLVAGDLGRLTAGGTVEVRHGVDLDAELDWTNGRLVFEDAPVGSAFTRLGRWYGVRLEAGDETMARRRFSGTVAGTPLPELLQALALALDARFERRGDTITYFTRSEAPARH